MSAAHFRIKTTGSEVEKEEHELHHWSLEGFSHLKRVCLRTSTMTQMSVFSTQFLHIQGPIHVLLWLCTFWIKKKPTRMFSKPGCELSHFQRAHEGLEEVRANERLLRNTKGCFNRVLKVARKEQKLR